MAPIRSAFARGLTLAQLAWISVLTLMIAAAAVDAPAAVLGAAVMILVVLAVAGQSALSHLRVLATSSTGPPLEEQRLRGAFRRQSAPDTPGRPRRPRAPGQVPAAL